MSAYGVVWTAANDTVYYQESANFVRNAVKPKPVMPVYLYFNKSAWQNAASRNTNP